MYLEEEMQGQKTVVGWCHHLSSRIDHILTQQQKMAGRLEALEHPLAAFEDGDRLEAMRRNLDRLIDEKAELEEEVTRLRSRLQMMQAGYNAIATIQSRLDANEQEMGGHRCAGIGGNIGTGQRGSL